MSNPSLPFDARSRWQRLRTTPIRDLLHGRLTGSLDVERIVADAQLPEPFPRLIAESAAQRWSAGGRARLAQYLAAHFQSALLAGAPAEQLVESFAQTSHAIRWQANPLVGLFAWSADRVDRRREVARLLAAANLPQPASQLIAKIARRTRLWRRERIDVARELAEHFHDGLAAGGSANQLVESFGEPRRAARLIRRAKLRSRPLAWRLWRRTWQAVVAIALLITAAYLFLVVRLFAHHPTIAHNYRLDVVRPTQGVPEADRAWPLYRQALLELTPEPQVAEPVAVLPDQGDGEPAPEPKLVPLDVGAEHPGSKNWGLVEKWLDENRAAIEATRQGAARRSFGFVYNDPADLPWFKSVGTDPKSMDPNENRELMGFLLDHMAQSRRLTLLLNLDALRARDKGDGQSFVADVQALVGLAEQLYRDLDFAVCKSISFAELGLALDLVDKTLDERPDLLSDHDLRNLAHRIAAYAGGGQIRLSLAGERLMIDDSLQRIYSDNGTGDGVLTAEGLKLLLDWAEILPLERAVAASAEQYLLRDPTVWPALALLVPSRRQMSQKLIEQFDQNTHRFDRPLWLWTPSEIVGAKNRGGYSPIDRLRNQPLLLNQWLPSAFFASELVTEKRDATLVALALVLYHRQHGAWPERLDELVPDLLPSVPPDRFTGDPLLYKREDGHPLLYSVGPDRRNDDGRSLEHPDDLFKLDSLRPEGDPPAPVPTGDWILWPPLANPSADNSH